MKRTPEQLLLLAKELKIDELNKEAIRVMDNVMAEYSTWEASAWSILREEAIQFLVDGTVGDYMAMEIGIKYNASQLALTILAKAEVMKDIRASIIKNRQAHEIAIDELTSIEDFDDYDLSTGWV